MKNKLFNTLNASRLGIDNAYALVQSTLELSLQKSALLDPLTQQALDYMQTCNAELEAQLKSTHTVDQTKQLSLLKKECNEFLASVRRNVKYFQKEGSPAQRLAAEQLASFLKPYSNLSRKAQNTQAALLAEMLGKYHADTELTAAADTLDIKGRMASLQTVNEAYILAYQQRNQRVASRTRSNSQLSRESLAAYRRFCMMLEQACLYTGNQAMAELIGELNGFRSKYHALMALNATALAKAKASKEDENEMPLPMVEPTVGAAYLAESIRVKAVA